MDSARSTEAAAATAVATTRPGSSPTGLTWRALSPPLEREREMLGFRNFFSFFLFLPLFVFSINAAKGIRNKNGMKKNRKRERRDHFQKMFFKNNEIF